MTSVHPQRSPPLEVGANYGIPFDRQDPWLFQTYDDEDFGLCVSDLEEFLATVSVPEIGVRVVRVFLHNHLSGFGAIEYRDAQGRPMADHHVRRSGRDLRKAIRWSYPEVVDRGLLKRRFRQVLEVFRRLRCQGVFSFFDFGAWGHNQRYLLVESAPMRRRLLDDMVSPLLEVALDYTDEVYAFEVQNEPIWNIQPFDASHHGALVVPQRAMVDFLHDGLERIQSFRRVGGARAFRSTVGHQGSHDHRPGVLRRLARFSALPAGDTPQFHFYPPRYDWIGSPVLEPWDGRSFIGEISAQEASLGTTQSIAKPWRQLGGADVGDQSRAVFERLRLCHLLRYRLALLWPCTHAREHPGCLGGDHARGALKFTPPVLEGIQRFKAWVARAT